MRRSAVQGLFSWAVVGLLLLAPFQGAAVRVGGPSDVAGPERESSLPEGFGPSSLEVVPPEQLAEQLREDLAELQPLLDAAGQAVNPVWLSNDGEAILRYVRDHTDPATGRFTFEGPTAELDAVVARSVAETLLQAGQQKALLESLAAEVRNFFASGELPDGVTLQLPTEDDVPRVLAGGGDAAHDALATGRGGYAEAMPAEVLQWSDGAHQTARGTTQEAHASLAAPARADGDGALHLASSEAAEDPPLAPRTSDALAALQAYPGVGPGSPSPPSGGAEEAEPPMQWPDDAPGVTGHLGCVAGCPIEPGGPWARVEGLKTDKPLYGPAETVHVSATVSFGGGYDSWCTDAGGVLGIVSGVAGQGWDFHWQGPLDGTHHDIAVDYYLENTRNLGYWSVGLSINPTSWVCPSAYSRVSFRVDINDLLIRNEDIKVDVLDETPPGAEGVEVAHPTLLVVQLAATYSVMTKECKQVQYTVRVEIPGGAPEHIPKSSTCPSDSILLPRVEIVKGSAGREDIKVILDWGNAVDEADEGNNVATKELGDASVVRVFPEWKGALLAGVPVVPTPHVYAFTQDYSERVERVRFSFQSAGSTASGFGRHYNLGETRQYEDKGGGLKLFRIPLDSTSRFDDAGEYILQAVGITEKGVETKPRETKIIVWDFPVVLAFLNHALGVPVEASWLGRFELFGAPGERTIIFAPLFIDRLELSLWDTKLDKTRLFPLDALKEETKIKAKIRFEVPVKSTDLQWRTKGRLEFEFCAPVSQLLVRLIFKDPCVKIRAEGTGTFADGKRSPGSWELEEFKLKVSFKLSFKLTILTWFLTHFGGLQGALLAMFIRRITEEGGLYLQFEPALDVTFLWRKGSPATIPGTDWRFQGTSIEAGFDGYVVAELGKKSLVRGGAKGELVYRMILNVDVDKGFDWGGAWFCPGGGCKLWFFADFFGTSTGQVLCCTWIPEGRILGEPTGAQLGSTEDQPGLVLKPLDRSWLGEGYAGFQGGAEGVLVEHAWPGADPALAARDAQRILIAYAHDIPGKPLGASTDVHYTAWNGETWSTPKEVEGNDVNDLFPVLAMGKGDEAAAVWQRMREPLNQNMTLDEMAAEVELVFSRYRFADDAWTARAQLTDNDKYEKFYSVASDGVGNYLVTWVEDGDGNIGTDESDTLWVRPFVAGQLMGAVKAATINTSHAPAVALLPGGLALVAWTTDPDHDLTTPNNRVVWMAGLPSLNQWTSPKEISNNTRMAREPSFARDNHGRLSLVWMEKVNGTTEEERNLQADVVMEARLAQAGAGVPPQALALAFESPQEIHREPYHEAISNPRLFYDKAGRPVLAWLGIGHTESVRYKVLQNGTTVKSIAKPGNLTAADYALLEDQNGDSVLFSAHLREDEQGFFHLDVPRRAVVSDVALTDLRVSPENPVPGTTARINVTLANVGDGETGTFNVTLKDSTGAFAIIPMDSLAPNATTSLETDWDVPGSDIAQTLEAIADEDQSTRDADRSNNAASTKTVVPDPAVEEFHPRARIGSIRLLASVKNVGARSMPATPVLAEVLEGGDVAEGIPPTPRTIGTTTLPPLARNQRGTVDVVLPIGVLPPGTHSLRLRVAASEDFNARDSSLEDTLHLAADLTAGLNMTRVSEGTYALVATVENKGTVATPPSSVEFRLGSPSDGPLVAAVPLPGLAPAQSVVVNATWAASAGDHDVYAVANPSRALDEFDYGNNVGHHFLRLQLPDLALDAGSAFFTPEGLDVTMWNRGEEPVSYAIAEALASSTIDGSPVLVRPTASFSGLQPQARATGRFAVEYLPYSLLAMNSTLPIVADPKDAIAELSADNNVIEIAMVAARSPTHPNTFDWFPSAIASFEFSALHTLNVSGYSYVLDQSPTTVPDSVIETVQPSASFGPLASGEYYLHVRAVDASGNATEPLHYRFRVQAADTLPPVTSVQLWGEQVRDDRLYVNQRTRFVLGAFDPSSPDGTSSRTGVAASYYRVDEGPATLYSAPFQLAGLPGGLHNVSYWSVDAAGNVESAKRLEAFLEVPQPPLVESAVTGFLADLGILYPMPGAQMTSSPP